LQSELLTVQESQNTTKMADFPWLFTVGNNLLANNFSSFGTPFANCYPIATTLSVAVELGFSRQR
jgi:hypothetical protein